MNKATLKEKYFIELQKDYSPEKIEWFFESLSKKCIDVDTSLAQDVVLSNTVEEKFEEILQKLKTKHPVEYILGEVEFYGRTFKVSPAVHVPRPESETLMQWVVEDFKDRAKKQGLSLLDIGTGSGVLPISLKKEMPEVRAMGMDISEEALAIARENASLLDASVEFLKTDLFKLEELPQKFDLIVSNPPYILKKAQKDVQRKFLKYEPPIALYVEDGDPMIFNRKIAQLAQGSLKPEGAVYLEINQYLKAQTEELFHKLGFKTFCRKDVFGNPRTIKAVKTEA